MFCLKIDQTTGIQLSRQNHSVFVCGNRQNATERRGGDKSNYEISDYEEDLLNRKWGRIIIMSPQLSPALDTRGEAINKKRERAGKGREWTEFLEFKLFFNYCRRTN